MKQYIICIVVFIMINVTAFAAEPNTVNESGLLCGDDKVITFSLRDSIRLPAKWGTDTVKQPGEFSITVKAKLNCDYADYCKMVARLNIETDKGIYVVSTKPMKILTSGVTAVTENVYADFDGDVRNAFIELENANKNEMFDITVYGIEISPAKEDTRIKCDRLTKCIVYGVNSGRHSIQYYSIGIDDETEYIRYAGFDCVLYTPGDSTAAEHARLNTDVSLAYIIGNGADIKRLDKSVLSSKNYLCADGKRTVFFLNEKAFDDYGEQIKRSFPDTVFVTAFEKGEIRLSNETVLSVDDADLEKTAVAVTDASVKAQKESNIVVVMSWDKLVPTVKSDLSIDTVKIDRMNAILKTNASIVRSIKTDAPINTDEPSVTPCITPTHDILFTPDFSIIPTAAVCITQMPVFTAMPEEEQNNGSEVITASIISVCGLFAYGGVKLIYSRIKSKKDKNR